MNPGIVAAIAYGILAVVGGIIGYKQAQSKASLISGTISGLLLILGGVLRSLGQTWGLVLATRVTVVIVVFFTIRLIKTRKFMPAGLMTVLGVAALVIMVKNM
jgi:uncharacterized membrane protein (UPF0136 family)